jgi:pyridoxine 5-phosphate synthase
MNRRRLGVNIDHVATIRNARGENYPDPLRAAIIAEKSGADSITIHLREDRRHIRDYDLANIKRKIKVPLNLEIAPTLEMQKIAIKNKPDFVCIVPEKRSEITTEGGLNLNKNKIFIKKMIKRLTKKNINVSLFIEPNISNVINSKEMGAHCVELHTGKYCNLFNKNKKTISEFKNLKKVANFAKKINLNVHAGHGLTFKSAKKISQIKSIVEFNIGHFIISESLFLSLSKTIKTFKKIINK